VNLSDYEYFRTENGVIYCGDCMEIMPMLEPVDLVLADPPYGMNFQSNHRNDKHDKIHGDHILPIDSIERAKTKARCAAYFFCRWDNIGEMPPPQERACMGQKQLEYG